LKGIREDDLGDPNHPKSIPFSETGHTSFVI